MSQRPIYVVCYHNSLFPAHWALWVPSYNTTNETEGTVGKLINVKGDARLGFRHEFVRNYDIKATTRSNPLYSIGRTDVANVTDGSGLMFIDTTATDVLEEWALRVPAPGPSLRAAGSSPSGDHTRVQIQNCQTWMYEFISKLVENGLLGADAMIRLDMVPKN